MYNWSNNRRGIARQACVALMALTCSFNAFSKEEITAFKLIDMRGYLEIPYSDDELSTRSAGTRGFEKTRTVTEEEIYFLTKSYIYHPRLLWIDLGLGLSFVQRKTDSGADRVAQDESPYRVDARFHFLSGKPYPITVFYNRENQTHGGSLERFKSSYVNKGFNLHLRSPLIPIDINLDGSSSKSEGTGFDYRYDDRVDLYSFRSRIPNGELGNHQLNFYNKEVTSSTGSLSLPVQQSVLKAENAAFNSQLVFGDQRQIQLDNSLTYQNQKSSRSLKDVRINPRLQWRHSDELRSYYRFNYLDSRQKQVDNRSRNMAAGFQHKMKTGLMYDAELHSNKNDTTGSAISNYGISASVNSSYKLSFGRLSLAAGANYDVNDRQVKTNPQIIGENLALTGTTPIQLSRDHIVPASIRVFEVFSGGTEQERSVGTTACTAGIDMLVITIGVRTELINCNGIAGVNVQFKVDYEYDSGGTLDYTSFSHNYQAGLDLFRYYRVYIRFSDSSHAIRSGISTLPLDEVQSKLFGAQVDYPLHRIVTLGSEMTYEQQKGTFTSFDRQTLNFSARFTIWSGNLMLSHNRLAQNYIGVSQDTDRVSNRLHYSARLWNSVSFSLEFSDIKDRGGSVPRRSSYQNLAFEWNIRKLRLKAEARLAQDEYGNSSRDQARILVTLRRDF